jgi:hypothetical protein
MTVWNVKLSPFWLPAVMVSEKREFAYRLSIPPLMAALPGDWVKVTVSVNVRLSPTSSTDVPCQTPLRLGGGGGGGGIVGPAPPPQLVKNAAATMNKPRLSGSERRGIFMGGERIHRPDRTRIPWPERPVSRPNGRRESVRAQAGVMSRKESTSTRTPSRTVPQNVFANLHARTIGRPDFRLIPAASTRPAPRRGGRPPRPPSACVGGAGEMRLRGREGPNNRAFALDRAANAPISLA